MLREEVSKVSFFTVEEKRKMKAWAMEQSFVYPFKYVDKDHPVTGYTCAFIAAFFNLVFEYLIYIPYLCLLFFVGFLIVGPIIFLIGDVFHWLFSFFQ